MQVRLSTLKLNDEDDYLGKGIEYMQCTFSAQGHRREPCFNPTGYMPWMPCAVLLVAHHTLYIYISQIDRIHKAYINTNHS